MGTHQHGSSCSHGKQPSSKIVQESHGHQKDVLTRLYIASALCCVFLVVEIIGGWLAGSLAVLSDAAHLFADLAGFGVAIGASHLAALPTTDQHTFGLKRMESLAALFSMVSLALVSVGLAFEAVRRLLMPPEEGVDGKLMSGIATIGVIVNIILAFVLGEHHVHLPGSNHSDHDHDHDHEHHHKHDEKNDDDHEENYHDSHEHDSHAHDHHEETAALSGAHDHDNVGYGSVHPLHADEVLPAKKPRNVNLEAAYLHVLGDLAQSTAVLVAGAIIWFKPEWHMVDPICTLLFCAMVFYSTLAVLRTSISVLLEEVPPNINWEDIYATISAIDGVENVHDLHIWSISHGIPSLSVHCMSTDTDKALKNVCLALKQKGINHTTIQVQQLPAVSCVTCDSVDACGTTRISQLLDASKLQGIIV